VDARSDLYAVGAIAYFLLTGRPPFEGETTMDVLFAHCNTRPPRPSTVAPDVPPELENVVLRCLAKAPDDRFPDADALSVALADCSVGAGWSPKRTPIRPAARSDDGERTRVVVR
jgi:serine/threonine protein kinase